MEPGGRGPKKTFVSTFRLDLKPSAPRFAVKGVKNGLDGKRTVQGCGEPGDTSSARAEHKRSPIHPLKAPRFKEPLKDCIVATGSDITLKGIIEGSQPLSISWLHNGAAVSSRKTSFQDGTASLALCKCSAEDAGLYTCVAENTAGLRSSSAALCVTEKKTILTANSTISTSQPAEKSRTTRPSIEEKIKNVTPKRRVTTEKGPPLEFQDPPEQVEVRLGEQAVLRCVFISYCVPVASCWIHNREKVVVDGPRTNVTNGEGESRVTISQASQDDAGLYTVVVRNPKGSARHAITLNVIGCPHPPASSPVFSQLSSTSLVLSWTGPSYDGGSAITGYVVEVRREGPEKPGDWSEVTTRCKNTSYRVRSGLESQGEYRFRVRASNAAGVSEPSEESDSIKMETKGGKREEIQSYVEVTVDTTHKVKDHYNVLEKLGVGKFAQVFRLTHKETGQVCAGKFYRARGSKEKAAACREMELMNLLHHTKLVQCYGAYCTRSEIVMVMEYIAGGELFERIVDDNFEHTEPTSARYMQQILEGIQYVHKQNIVHLDLKPENIVCVDTTGTRIKIIDFGLARKLEPGVPLMVMHGTPEFVAPEVISYEPVGLETDMWSIAVICFILLSGESPFQGNSDAETLALVTAACYEFHEDSFEDISDLAKDFIGSLLKKDMRCRPSCDEALAHPWMASFTMNRRPTKSLRKDKMRHFLARRKWKKTGKAVLALQRMTLLSNRPDSPGSPGDEPSWSPDAEQAILSLEQELQGEPRFQQALTDLTLPRGTTARLACLIQGYPEPEVVWLQDEDPLEESSRIAIEYEEDGRCTLALTQLVPADAGVYTCRATNDQGVALCSATLTVEL